MEFAERKQCPEEGCKAHFKFKDGFVHHLMSAHEYEKEDAEGELTMNRMKVKDRLIKPVNCTICGSKWWRRSLLLRHVKTVHQVKDHVSATNITKIMVEKAALTNDQKGMDEDGGQEVESGEEESDDNLTVRIGCEACKDTSQVRRRCHTCQQPKCEEHLTTGQDGFANCRVCGGEKRTEIEEQEGIQLDDQTEEDEQDEQTEEDEQDEQTEEDVAKSAKGKKKKARRGDGEEETEVDVEIEALKLKMRESKLAKWKVKFASKKSKKDNINLTAKCPECEKRFTKTYNVRRHLMDKHGVDKDRLAEYVIKPVHSRCKYCKEFFGNVQKHERVCKLRNEETVRQKKVADIPDAFLPGGGLLLDEWHEWIKTCDLAESTIGLYTRKLIHILKFLEGSIDNFLADSLLLPLENEVQFPSLNPYLAQAKKADAKIAICTYEKLADLVVYLFDTRYGADPDFTLMEKNAFTTGVMNARKSQSVKLKGINRALAEDTSKKSAERATDPEELLHNPERLKEVLVFVLRNKEMKAIQDDLVTLQPDELKNKYDKSTLTNFLKSHIVMEGKKPL